MSQAPASATAEWRAHWPIVLSGMIGMSYYAMLTYHFGLFIQPLQKEFGWDRASISLGLTIYTVSAVLFGPVIGALIDKFGSRMIGIIGLALTSLSFAALGFADGTLMQWYLLWLVIAVTALAVKSTVWGAAVSSLFTTSRSLALSLVLTGSAIAQFSAPLVANWLIAEYGWRAAYQWIGLGWGGLALVLVLFFFFDAHDKKAKVGAASVPVSSLGGLTVKQALRSPQILRIGLGNVLLALLGSGVAVHMVPLLSQTGIDRTTAAAIAGSAGISGVAGKLVTGWLMDRYQGNIIPFSSFAMGALGYFLLLDRLDSVPALFLAALILGYGSGAGLQVTTYLTSRYGGLRNFGKIYATMGSTLMLGTSIGPWIAGSIYDNTGGYEMLLYLAMPVALAVALMFVGLGPYPVFKESDGLPGNLSAPVQPRDSEPVADGPAPA
jgi:MFS family permease